MTPPRPITNPRGPRLPLPKLDAVARFVALVAAVYFAGHLVAWAWR